MLRGGGTVWGEFSDGLQLDAKRKTSGGQDRDSVTEAAEALGISRPSMYNLIHTEGFPTLKVGGRRKISKELLSEWVKEQAKKNYPG